MKEIRISGSTEEELKEAIKLVLSHQEYDRVINFISHIKTTDNAVFGYELHDFFLDDNGYRSKYSDMELPLPIDIEGFASMIALWWSNKLKPYYHNTDGTSKKGFIISSGRNWGQLDASSEFGEYSWLKDMDTEPIVEMQNLACITIIINEQVWGK